MQLQMYVIFNPVSLHPTLHQAKDATSTKSITVNFDSSK